jgi:ABC-type uncharacterized transport system permease subunit
VSSTLLASVAAALYLAATMRYQKSLYAQNESNSETWNRGKGFILAAFMVQSLSLVAAGVEARGFPMTLPQSLSLMCWMMVGIYLLVGARWKMEMIGAFAAPAATLMMMAMLATVHLGRAIPESRDPMLGLHVACIVLGYASFLLATMVAALYFFQTFLLKRKNVTGLFQKMPSLENLDRVTYRLITVGFFPMIIGIGLGFFRAESRGQSFWSVDVLLGLLTVVIYALYINARLLGGWQGRKVNALLLVGFVFLVATYVGIGLPWSVHQR